MSAPTWAQDAAALRQAEALATEATAFFKAGLHAKAAGRFMEAYALSKRPALVFNAARAYEEAHDDAEAIALFQLYRTLPDVKDAGRKDADDRIAKLQAVRAEAAKRKQEDEARLAAERKPELKPDVRPEPEPKAELKPELKPALRPEAKPGVAHPDVASPPSTERWQTSTVLELSAAGGLVAASAAVYYAAWQEAQAAIDVGPVRTEADIARYLDHAGAARTWRAIAVGTATAGVALAAWGTYDLLKPKTATTPHGSLFVAPAADGVTFVCSGRW